MPRHVVSFLIGLGVAVVVWLIARAFGCAYVAAYADLILAGMGLVFAASLFTGGYLGRPSVTYLDDNYSPLISARGGLCLTFFSLALIVAAFVSALAGCG